LITGEPELPPMMSAVRTKLSGVFSSTFDRRSSQRGGRKNGGSSRRTPSRSFQR
jgi:hypothetical protein